MIKNLINKVLNKFHYVLEHESFELMYANGDQYVSACKLNGIRMSYMLLANHLFGAAVALLSEEDDISDNKYIHYYNLGAIEPPATAALLMSYITSHPDEGKDSLFMLMLRCVRAAEIPFSGMEG
ncbi:hypothetical protein Lsai_2517 [Legionella sainthelensi]|uniref:Uncharacterized protein n=1 Tax=Legionella sainthelensi TaxID=28087 RepID=A0A0W0YDD7_9GAMM|nr:hypothetical protein [Legionella sainthelensi]KTD54925.1 hypothetical protein Lsai_2517 [Legionella sainthelensi]VEH37333.1 Uncharacterised protein [Legionella sainthelensi]